jgi:hypothetical protein
MQVSLDPAKWQEDVTEEAARHRINRGTSDAEKRILFPLSGRLKAKSPAYPFVVGQVFKFVRTKDAPSRLPFEALAWTTDGVPRILMFYKHELELLPPQEE